MKGIDKKFLNFCENLGSDNTLVQGAGGNISIKDDKYIYVKGSGKWISNASKENIFAVLELKKARDNLYRTDLEHVFSNDSLNNIRPSIETSFHLLLDSKIVVHLHETFSLSVLVMKKYKSIIDSIMPSNFSFCYVDYVKPGKDLAKSIKNKLDNLSSCDYIFLQNHGVIICGNTSDEIKEKIEILRERVKLFLNKGLNKNINNTKSTRRKSPKTISISGLTYKLISRENPCIISSNNLFIKHLKDNWAYSPDHVVFLGKSALFFETYDEALQSDIKNELIFIKNFGIYYSGKNPMGVIDQLECFIKVFQNILATNYEINTLDNNQIDELLNWEEERFRQSISK